MRQFRAVAMIAAFAAAALSRPAPATAQDIFLGAAAHRVTNTSASGTMREYTGFLFGAQGRLRYSIIALEVGYGEGTLDDNVRGNTRNVVEGYALAGLSPVPWLTILAGPHARAFDTSAPPDDNIGIGLRAPDEPSERWLLWEVRARLEAPLFEIAEPAATFGVFAEGRYATGADIDINAAFDQGRGGEVGLAIRLGQPPIALRFAYEMDEARMATVNRIENVESLKLAIGLAWPGFIARPATAMRTPTRPR